MKIQKSFLKTIYIVAFVLLTFVSGVTANDKKTISEFNGRIDVGGYELYYVSFGEGSPTVIMDSALGDCGSSSSWRGIQKKIAEQTRVLCYDRAGMCKSDLPLKTPRTTQDMVKDLHTLLVKTNIAGPYVYVAHSISGLNARLFANQYPKDVVGMVLVDVSHPDQNSRSLAALPPESPKESYLLKDYRYNELSNEPKGSKFEFFDWKSSTSQVNATGSLGNIPLVVLTAKSGFWVPPVCVESIRKEWLQMQKELVKLSSNSTHIITENSSHYINVDEPELVIDAIQNVLTQVQIQ